jgi:hypothetical protein
MSEYQTHLDDSQQSRTMIDNYYEQYPELFPPEMGQGYHLRGFAPLSKKMSHVKLRRIGVKQGEERVVAYSVVPCDVLPYMTGMVDDVEKGLFLKKFGVPNWALAHVLGQNEMYWYRQEVAWGRYNLVGSTVKKEEALPEDLLADEKHGKIHGEKCYIATTVGGDCVLGAAISETADEAGLSEAYGQFKQEATTLNPTYQPKTVNIDGWRATHNAWTALFPKIVIILCFLHAFLKIRKCSKRLVDIYPALKQQVWHIYHSANALQFQARIQQLKQWIIENKESLTTSSMEAVDKLCQKSEQFCLAFDYPNAYRTSNMIDRHMIPMARWLVCHRYFHGHLQSAELQMRAWALLHNYAPYCPRAKISKTYQSPAHQLNGFQYRENWLENLLVSTSCQGFRCIHKKS